MASSSWRPAEMLLEMECGVREAVAAGVEPQG